MSQIVISANNSTIAPLGAGQSFVGTADILTSYQEVDITVDGAPSDAPGMLIFEYSPDADHWATTVSLSLAGPSTVPITLRTIQPYFRVRYVNGATPLTELRLTSTFHRDSAMRLTRFLHQPLDPNEPVEVVRVGKGPTSAEAVAANVAQSDTSVTLLAANVVRLGATIFNDTTSRLLVKLGPVASLTSCSFPLKAGGVASISRYTGVIDGIWLAAGSGAARVTELVP